MKWPWRKQTRTIKVEVNKAIDDWIAVGDDGWVDCNALRFQKIARGKYMLQVQSSRTAPPATSVLPLLVADEILERMFQRTELSPCGAAIEFRTEPDGFVNLTVTTGVHS